MIDVVVTERGIAINPLRKDLLSAVSNSSLPLRKIEDLKNEIDEICGGEPAKPSLKDNVVAVVKWVDGTVIDSIRQVDVAPVE